MSDVRLYHSLGGVRLFLGWGRPSALSHSEAENYSRELRAGGRCGEVTEGAPALGWLVCGGEPDACEDRGYHRDSRHEALWDLATADVGGQGVSAKPMDAGRLDRFRAEAERMAGRYESLPGATTILDLLAAHDYWRARCPVTAEDVLARKVTPDRALAYALADCWCARDEDDVAELEGETWTIVVLVSPTGVKRDDRIVLCNNVVGDGPLSVADACNRLAKVEGRAPHDVLDEMAAKACEDGE